MDDPVMTTSRDLVATPLLDPARSRGRVAIVSGSYGAGHDAAGPRDRDPAGRSGLRDRAPRHRYPAAVAHRPAVAVGLLRPLRLSPRSWGLTLRLLADGTLANRVVTRALGSASRRLAQATEGADLVVSTHPFASQAVGRPRSRLAVRPGRHVPHRRLRPSTVGAARGRSPSRAQRGRRGPGPMLGRPGGRGRATGPASAASC